MKTLPKWLTAFSAIAILNATPATADHHAEADETADPWADYSAHGTEPFWTLRITEDRLEFEHSSVLNAAAERPDSQPAYPGTLFIGQSENPGARDFIVLINDGVCNDGMADQVWPHFVRIFVDGGYFHGCGGDSADMLSGAEWRILTISGEDVPAAVGQTLQFDTEGGISGYGGCNRYMGSYELGGGIELGPIASTRRACSNPETGHFENALLTALGTVYGFDISDSGELSLLGGDGIALTAQR